MRTLFDGQGQDEMRELFVDAGDLVAEETTDESSFCLVAYNRVIEMLLESIYGRDHLCLKIFNSPAKNLTVKMFKWGGFSLWECVLIQNLFAGQGIAPRVFDVVRVGERLAQVTSFVPVGEQPSAERLAELRSLTKAYDVETRKNHWDVNPRNWRSNLFVDFSGFRFNDLAAYEADLVRRAHTRRGKYLGVAYQPVAELGIRGTRDMESRVQAMRLDEIDFKGKTVLDIGCNLGYLCRWAKAHGGRRVVGIDRIAALAYEIANCLGDWQTDYLSLRLPDQVGEILFSSEIERFDIVIATAVVKHVGGLAAWLVDLCQDVFIFEGHGSIAVTAYEPWLRDHFGETVYLGETDDNYRRHLFRCRV